MNNLLLQKWTWDNNLKINSKKNIRIAMYEPFHIRYQFGHYPTKNPYSPGKKDLELLDLYAELGGGIINLWYWNEWTNLFGKTVFEAMNDDGVKLFVNEAHKRNIKVIPYVSPGYLDVQNIIYNPKWSRNTTHLMELSNDFDRLCPGSTSWRKYFFEGLDKMIDIYDFDGIYWDGGIGQLIPGCSNKNCEDHLHFIEVDPSDFLNGKHVSEEVNKGYLNLWEDFLAEMYCIVKKKDGIIVAHIGGDKQNPFNQKWWDYLLLGEGVPDILTSLNKTKDYDPYVIRFNDWSKLITNWKEKDLTPDISKVAELEHLAMAGSIVYLQFPWLEDGSYGETEELETIPGTKWKKGYDHWTEWMRAQKKAGLVPLGNASWVAGRERYVEYLRLFKKMTIENTLAFIEINDQNDLPFPTSSGQRRVTVYVNDYLWVAIANLAEMEEVMTVKSLNGEEHFDIKLQEKKLTVLKYQDLKSLPKMVEF